MKKRDELQEESDWNKNTCSSSPPINRLHNDDVMMTI